MNRGISQKSNLAFALIIVLSSSTALAKKTSGKDAPTQEDFYSTVSTDVSDAEMAQAEALRLKTLKEIRALSNDKKTQAAQRFELLLRDGELNAERHDYILLKEQAEYDRAYASWLAEKKKGKEPKIKNEKSTAALRDAAQAFRTLVRDYPKHPRAAAAMYALGKTLARLGEDSCIDYFEKLIQYHPKSEFVADAYLAAGDYYFDKNRADSALQYYQKMLAFKQHGAYPYAVYKLGWAHYNSPSRSEKQTNEHIKKSIAAFQLVIELANKDKQTRSGRINLTKEATNDLIMVWSETEETDAAWAYFKKIGDQKAFYVLLARLGDSYVRKGRNAEAVAVYTRLIKENENSQELPVYYETLAKMYEVQSDVSSATKTLLAMSSALAPTSSWSGRFKNDKDLLKETRVKVEFNLKHYGTLFHTRAQKAKLKAYELAAVDLYTEYLKNFTGTASENEIRFYLADLQLDAKKYIDSSKNFVMVSKTGDKKYAENAAKNAVIAMNSFDETQKIETPKLTTVQAKPLEIPKSKVLLISVIDNYTGLFPKTSDFAKMRFTVMSLYYAYGHYDKALPMMDELAKLGSKSPEGDAAIKMRLAYAESRKDWKDLEKKSREFSDQKPPLSAKTLAVVVASLRVSVFSQALELEKASKFKEAGERFMAYQKEFSGDLENGPKALFNAASNFYKAGQLEAAINAHVLLIDKYSKSDLGKESLLAIAETYNALADFKNAAVYFERYQKTHPRSPKASLALYNAAVLQKGLQNEQKASELLNLFVNTYPQSERKGDASLALAESLEKQGKTAPAAKMYGVVASEFEKKDVDTSFMAEAKKGVLLGGHAGSTVIQSVKRKLLKKDSPDAFESRRIIAAQEFSRLSPRVEKFRTSGFSSKNLERDIVAKQRELEFLAKEFEQIINLQSPEYHVASVYSLGLLHESFAEKLFDANPDSSMPEGDKLKLKTTLDQLAIPLREEAYKFFETAVARAEEVETFSVWTEKAYNKLASIGQKNARPVEEQTVEPEYMIHDLITGNGSEKKSAH